MGEFLSSLSGDQKGNLIIQATKLVPAIIGFSQAKKAKDQQQEYLDDIKTLEQNRQEVINPYANVTNPYANLQVATKAAEMQADQTDIALANTLDNLRQTGAGGATALAQAALRSKQGISADKSFINPEAQNFGATPNIGSGFDASQLYNNSDQAYSDLMSADLDTMIEQDIPFGGFED